MQIQNLETWSVESTGTKTIKIAGNRQGDRVASAMYINPLSDITLVVKGFISDDDTQGVELACVDIANLSKATEVETAGTYLFIVEPFYKVVITAAGTADVIIKSVY